MNMLVGLLEKIMPLVNHVSTRLVALQLLLVVIHLGGQSHFAQIENIARKNGTLVGILQNNEEDHRLTELVVTVMAHTIQSTVILPPNQWDNGGSAPWAQTYGVHGIIRATLSILRSPSQYSSSSLINAFSLLVFPTRYYPQEYKHSDTSSTRQILVAFLRSEHLITRSIAMDAIINLAVSDSERDNYAMDLDRMYNILTGSIRLPSSLADVTIEHCYANGLYSSTTEYMDTMSRFVLDHKLYEHGHTIADLVQRFPAAVEGDWGTLEDYASVPRASRLPFLQWSDVLPEFAKALRLTADPTDQDAADILDMKYLILRDRVVEAVALGRKAIARNPHLAYAYYIISLSPDADRSYHAAEKGLACPDVTEFLRNQLQGKVVDLGVARALEILDRAVKGNVLARDEVQNTLSTALAHAQSFTERNPLDDPLMPSMLGWRIIITVVLRGSGLRIDLAELQVRKPAISITLCGYSLIASGMQPLFKKFEKSTEFLEFFGYSTNKTAMHLACNRIQDTYQSSAEEWETLIHLYDSADAREGCMKNAGIDKRLSEWLGRVECSKTFPNPPKASHHCAFCRSSSAHRVLKQCKGCQIARYG